MISVYVDVTLIQDKLIGMRYCSVVLKLFYNRDFILFFIQIHEVSKKLGLLWLAKVPTYLCLLFIVMRFAVLFYLAVKKKWLWLPSEREV